MPYRNFSFLSMLEDQKYSEVSDTAHFYLHLLRWR